VLTIAALTNKERVGRSAELLRKALRPFVERHLIATFGDGWHDHVESQLRKHDPPADRALDDLGILLYVLLRDWDDVFCRPLDGADRRLFQTVKDVRNQWAHRPQEEFTVARATELLSSIVEILEAIDAKSEALAVRDSLEALANNAVSEADGRLRAILVHAAASALPFRIALDRGKCVGASHRDLETAAKALRDSQLLIFDDPLTETTTIRLS
jgi:hypothetical protein